MDYKEKYEKALEWMKSIYPTMQGSDKEDAEHYFPELAESEDERMINGLQGFLSAFGSDYFGTDGWQKFDDWLEWQKEQKPAENGGKELLYVSNKSYNIGYRDGKREAEQKQEWSEEDEKQIRQIERIVKNAGCTQKLQEQIHNWLKSLRPSWKPSEEQMEALKSKLPIIKGTGNNVDSILESLYEQLKQYQHG